MPARRRRRWGGSCISSSGSSSDTAERGVCDRRGEFRSEKSARARRDGPVAVEEGSRKGKAKLPHQLQLPWDTSLPAKSITHYNQTSTDDLLHIDAVFLNCHCDIVRQVDGAASDIKLAAPEEGAVRAESAAPSASAIAHLHASAWRRRDCSARARVRRCS